MSTVYSPGNESIFNYIESDMADSNTLLLCLDNAVSRINVMDGRGASAYVGLPGIAGYREGSWTEARFRTVNSLTQVNTSHMIVGDQLNYCLRWVDRGTGLTTPFAGRCTEQGTSGRSQTELNTTTIRFISPRSLLLDRKVLYVADDKYMYHISVETLQVLDASFESEYRVNSMTGLQSSLIAGEFIGTVDTGLVSIDNEQKRVSLVSGENIVGEEGVEGNLTSIIFRQLKAIIHLYSNMYIAADYGGHRLRGLDFHR